MKTFEPRTVREVVDALHTIRSHRWRLGHDAAIDRGGLHHVGPIEPRSMTVVAQAGAPLHAVEAVLATAKLSLGALPPQVWSLRVGEFTEGPYAGLRAIAGGRLEPVAVRLEGVFADGRVFTGGPGPRSAAGPDLTSLFLGGGGRLGLVTSATLRAFERPASFGFASARFLEAREAVNALTTALAHGVVFDRVQFTLRETALVARLEWSGSTGHVERNREAIHRAMSQVDHSGAGDRPSAAPAPLTGVVREATWPQVESALRRVRELELHRLSLTTVVCIGEVDGVSLTGNDPTSWSPLARLLVTAADPAQMLGGLL